MPQKITTFLWFDKEAEQAAKFYVSAFKNKSKITNVWRYGEAGPGKKGSVMVVEFKLEGQAFMALNGGPGFPHTQAISLYIRARDQKETDALWRRLLKGGGKEVQCGWLTDRFGVSWQVVPKALHQYVGGKDRKKADRVFKAMLQMVKIDVKALERAAAGA
jgi:predicted 3-demethylubiquinone-9 3-methyltransferase (glyoxalase superfamily)